jgi:hypothetical protein
LGKLFNTTKYGSDTFEKNGDHHSKIAINTPSITPEINPISVSVSVTPKCVSSPLADKFKKGFNILEG